MLLWRRGWRENLTMMHHSLIVAWGEEEEKEVGGVISGMRGGRIGGIEV